MDSPVLEEEVRKRLGQRRTADRDPNAVFNELESIAKQIRADKDSKDKKFSEDTTGPILKLNALMISYINREIDLTQLSEKMFSLFPCLKVPEGDIVSEGDYVRALISQVRSNRADLFTSLAKRSPSCTIAGLPKYNVKGFE